MSRSIALSELASAHGRVRVVVYEGKFLQTFSSSEHPLHSEHAQRLFRRVAFFPLTSSAQPSTLVFLDSMTFGLDENTLVSDFDFDFLSGSGHGVLVMLPAARSQ